MLTWFLSGEKGRFTLRARWWCVIVWCNWCGAFGGVKTTVQREGILSLNQLIFYILKQQILFCLKHDNIPSYGGEFRGTKKPLLPPIFFSTMVYVYFQDNQLTIIVMSSVNSRLTPVEQERNQRFFVDLMT